MVCLLRSSLIAGASGLVLHATHFSSDAAGFGVIGVGQPGAGLTWTEGLGRLTVLGAPTALPDSGWTLLLLGALVVCLGVVHWRLSP